MWSPPPDKPDSEAIEKGGNNNIYQANFAQIYPEDRGTNYAIREGKNAANLIQNTLKS